MDTDNYIITSLDEDRARIEFAELAAKAFAADPGLETYGEVKPNAFLGIRWGLLNRNVMVVKLADVAGVVYRDSVMQS